MNLHLQPPFPCCQKSDFLSCFCNCFFVKEKRSIICILPPWQSRYCWPGEEGHLLQQDLNVLVGAIARWNSPRRPWQHIFKNIMLNIDDMKYVCNFMFTTTWNVHYKNDTWQLDLPLWNEYHAKVPLGPQTHQHLSRSSSWTHFQSSQISFLYTFFLSSH